MTTWVLIRAALLTFAAVMLYYAGLYLALKLLIISCVALARLIRPRRKA